MKVKNDMKKKRELGISLFNRSSDILSIYTGILTVAYLIIITCFVSFKDQFVSDFIFFALACFLSIVLSISILLVEQLIYRRLNDIDFHDKLIEKMENIISETSNNIGFTDKLIEKMENIISETSNNIESENKQLYNVESKKLRLETWFNEIRNINNYLNKTKNTPKMTTIFISINITLFFISFTMCIMTIKEIILVVPLEFLILFCIGTLFLTLTGIFTVKEWRITNGKRQKELNKIFIERVW